MSANDRQVGGDHYKVGGEEHWDRVSRLNMPYLAARATAYIERAPNKNRKADIEKAIHFLEKYLELFDMLHPVKEPGDNVGWAEETAARQDYEIEGYKTDGTALFKCKHCRQEAWGILALRSRVEHQPTCPLYPMPPVPPEGL